MAARTDKYEQKQEEIARSAFSLFRSKGFEDTSVKEIADASGIKKALVRYYFPQKEAFEELFLHRSLDMADRFYQELEREEESPLQRFYYMGYIELYYISKHEPMLKLGRDIMRSRELTRTVQSSILSWIRKNVELSEEEFKKLTEGIVFATGAAFEYIYYHMQENEPFDMDYIFRVAGNILEDTTGSTLDITSATVLMPDSWPQEKCKEMDKALFHI